MTYIISDRDVRMDPNFPNRHLVDNYRTSKEGKGKTERNIKQLHNKTRCLHRGKSRISSSQIRELKKIPKCNEKTIFVNSRFKMSRSGVEVT